VQIETVETFRRLMYSPMRDKLFELNYSESAQTALGQLQVTSPYFSERAFTIAILDTIKANATRPAVSVE
jgi:nicotinamide riboside kinase